MARQGKCDKDQRRYVWDKEMQISLVYCPMCGGALEKTTHLAKFHSWFGELTGIPKGYTLTKLMRIKQESEDAKTLAANERE